MSGFALDEYDPFLAGNGQHATVSELYRPTWRRSIARIGGYKIGTVQLTSKELTRGELDERFKYGLLRELREHGGNRETWRGLLVKMEYNRAGDTFIRDVSMMANAIRSIYTRIGDNMLTNGGAESGVWSSYAGGTVTQSTEWVSQGTYSGKIVASGAGQGATIQAVIPITAGIGYLIRGTLHVISGSWKFSSNRADNGQSLAFFSTGGTVGDHAAEIYIPESNTYMGNADLRISAESAGTIYVDACVVQTAPARAETGWYTDMRSIAVHGRKEDILLRPGMSNADANDEVQSDLLKRAWAHPSPPRSGVSITKTAEDSLTLTFAGYWCTLNWLYSTLAGTRTRSAWVAALLAQQAQFLLPGKIETNANDFLVDSSDPLRLGDTLRQIANAGATGGQLWGIGVYSERKLNYQAIPQELKYYRRQGQLFEVSGNIGDPWRARPGWALWQDMPLGPGSLTTNPAHDPRWQFLEEIEMLPPSEAAADGSLQFNLDDTGESA